MDPAHQFHADPAQRNQVVQSVSGDHNIRHLSGDRRTAADRDSRVRRRQCRRIVDTVADHNHLMSIFLLFPHKSGFFLRQHLRVKMIHADLRSDGRRRAVTVPGHHHKIPETMRPQFRDHILRLRAKRIFDTDHCRQNAGDRQIQMRVLVRHLLKFFFFSLRNHTFLIFEDKVVTSDHHFFPADRRCNSVSDNIIDFGVHFLVKQSPLFCLLHHRSSHGMGKMLFQTGRHPQHFILRISAERNHRRNSRLCLRQRSRLVEHHRVRLGHSLQKLSSLYGNLILPRLTHCRQNGNGHRQFQRAGEIHHQNRQRFLHIPCHQPGKNRTAQTERHQPVRQCSRFSFYRGFQLF